MHRYVVAVFVMFCVIVILVTTHYLDLRYHMAKTFTAKKLAREEAMSIQEAEGHLDTDAFLDEYP